MQLEAVPRNFTELPEIFWRDKGASDQIEFVEVSNPFGILLVGFLAFDGFDIFRMRKAHVDVIFEVIKNRNPVLASGFHTDMIAVILDKPVMKLLNIRVDGRKGFLIILRYSIFVGSYDGCNDNVFVDVKSTADGVF